MTINLKPTGSQSAPSGLGTPSQLIAFDAYMLVFIIVAFEVIGCSLLHLSQKWYGPKSIRYQVASGQSLSIPPWKGLYKKNQAQNSAALDISNNIETTDVPAAPPAHLVAKDIVYEVDVKIADEKEKASDELSESLLESKTDDLDYNDEVDIPLTARDYGQTGKGALADFVLSRQGLQQRTSSSLVSSVSKEQVTEIDPPEPGRLRLLSGITASFEPGTLNALMGESGAGKVRSDFH